MCRRRESWRSAVRLLAVAGWCHCGRWNIKPFLETDSWNLLQSKVNWAVFSWLNKELTLRFSHPASLAAHRRWCLNALWLQEIVTRNVFVCAIIIRDRRCERLLEHFLGCLLNWSRPLWFSLIQGKIESHVGSSVVSKSGLKQQMNWFYFSYFLYLSAWPIALCCCNTWINKDLCGSGQLLELPM